MKREGKCEGKGVGRCLKAGTMCEEGPPVATMTVRRAYPCSGGQNSRLYNTAYTPGISSVCPNNRHPVLETAGN